MINFYSQDLGWMCCHTYQGHISDCCCAELCKHALCGPDVSRELVDKHGNICEQTEMAANGLCAMTLFSKYPKYVSIFIKNCRECVYKRNDIIIAIIARKLLYWAQRQRPVRAQSNTVLSVSLSIVRQVSDPGASYPPVRLSMFWA